MACNRCLEVIKEELGELVIDESKLNQYDEII